MKNRKEDGKIYEILVGSAEMLQRLTLKINKLNCLWDHFNNRKSEAFVEKWEGELKTSKIF